MTMVELNEKALEAAEKAWIGDTRLGLYPERRDALANAITVYIAAARNSEEHRRRAAGPSEVKWPMPDPLKKYKDAALPAPDDGLVGRLLAEATAFVAMDGEYDISTGHLLNEAATALRYKAEQIERLTRERDVALENYTRAWNERDAQRRLSRPPSCT